MTTYLVWQISVDTKCRRHFPHLVSTELKRFPKSARALEVVLKVQSARDDSSP